MEINQISRLLGKAGISARPKALKIIKEHIEGLAQFLTGDVDMHDENDMNSSNHNIDPEDVVKLIITKFEEVQQKSNKKANMFLEESVVQQIFTDSFNIESLAKINQDKNGTGSKIQKKSFKNLTSNKSEEEKVAYEDDPYVKLLYEKVLVLDSFTDIPKPSYVGKFLNFEPKAKKTLLTDPDSRNNFYQNRLKFVKCNLMDEVMKTSVSNQCDSKIVPQGFDNKFGKHISFRNINACLGTSDTIYCIGYITRGQNTSVDGQEFKSYYLEDDTMKVKLDFSNAESDKDSYFTEGNIVLVQGRYINA